MAETTKSFARRVLVAVTLGCLVILAFAAVYFTLDILLLIFAAALLAIFLRGLADLIRPWVPLGDIWLVLIVTGLLISLVGVAVALLAPSVADQIQVLRQEIPVSAARAAEFLSNYKWGQAVLNQLPTLDDVLTKIDAGTMLTRVGGYFSSTLGAVGNIFITVLVAVYFASEPRFYSQGLTQLLPVPKRTRAGDILTAIYETLRWWLIGKAASMIFIAIVTWIGLSILGVPLALTLGLIAGLLSFIPNFGPIISAVPAILLAFIDSPMSAVYTAGLYVGVQLIESNIVTPVIERKTVELPPALTIVFQLVLGTLIGGLGLVLATPLLAVLVVLVRMIYLEDILGDRKRRPGRTKAKDLVAEVEPAV